ncbi:chemotaxis protein CheW [Massilia terrae]|uniref:Chemotaxis protein CheW n=1 Tax=Massilia terrae TaxID=1811224 RepID=A0ABT2D3E1_9BURK|nr:chemotaxis protein CheW [Massilia terrae]
MNLSTAGGFEQDCWNRIGVRGDRSCGQLEQYVHCRNCPAYAQAAQRTLQVPVEPSYRESWAEQLRRPKPCPQVGDASALLFRIGGEWLALPSGLALSVAPLGPVHRLPHRERPGLLGVVNIGGRLAPAIALGPLLGIGAESPPAVEGRHVFGRLLVIAAGAHSCALPVTELHGIVRYDRGALATPAQPWAAQLDGVLAHDGVHAGLLNGALLARRIGELLR